MALITVFGAITVACTGIPSERVDEPDATGPDDPPRTSTECAAQRLLGAPSPVSPAWCLDLSTGAGTSVASANAWRDDFNHGLSSASMDPGYRVFNHAPAFSASCNAAHFRHNDHWMTDLGTNGCDGVLMRPDAPFRFRNGALVVEATVAAGIDEYGGRVWPEIVVTTAPHPASSNNSELYAYTMFQGHWSFGCRLQAGRVPICALFNASGRGSGDGGRVMEISFFQHENAASVIGGEPGPPGGERDRAWRRCGEEDPDASCRDRFRLELTDRDVRLFVNGTLYMAHLGLPAEKRLPPAMTDGALYVYFASWSWRLGEVANGARFHWDDLAVNPD